MRPLVVNILCTGYQHPVVNILFFRLFHNNIIFHGRKSNSFFAINFPLRHGCPRPLIPPIP